VNYIFSGNAQRKIGFYGSANVLKAEIQPYDLKREEVMPTDLAAGAQVSCRTVWCVAELSGS
jgi:hypothetical protein